MQRYFTHKKLLAAAMCFIFGSFRIVGKSEQ